MVEFWGSVFSCLRNLHIVFCSVCTNVHFHQQCATIPFSPYALQQLLCSFWWEPPWQVWGGISLWSWFAFSFSWYLMMSSTFSCSWWPSACLLSKNVCSVLLPFFKKGQVVYFLMLSCMSWSYMLDSNHLPVILFASIFSHSTGCIFLIVSFAMQKF